MFSAPGPSLAEQRIHLKMISSVDIWCFRLDGATGAPVVHPTPREGPQCCSRQHSFSRTSLSSLLFLRATEEDRIRQIK